MLQVPGAQPKMTWAQKRKLARILQHPSDTDFRYGCIQVLTQVSLSAGFIRRQSFPTSPVLPASLPRQRRASFLMAPAKAWGDAHWPDLGPVPILNPLCWLWLARLGLCVFLEVRSAPPNPRGLRVGGGGREGNVPKEKSRCSCQKRGPWMLAGCWACAWRQIHVTLFRNTCKLTYNKKFNIIECLLRIQHDGMEEKWCLVLKRTRVKAWWGEGRCGGPGGEDNTQEYPILVTPRYL